MLKDKLIILLELAILFALFLVIFYEIPFCIKSFIDFWTLVWKAIQAWALVPVTAINQHPIPKILLGLRSKINSRFGFPNPARSWGPTDRQVRCW